MWTFTEIRESSSDLIELWVSFFPSLCSLEMDFKEGKRSTEWVKKPPEVVLALNSEETRLTGKEPVDPVKDNSVDAWYRKITCEWMRACTLLSERWSKSWICQRRASDCSSWNWVASLRNSLIWKKLSKMNFSIGPNPWRWAFGYAILMN